MIEWICILAGLILCVGILEAVPFMGKHIVKFAKQNITKELYPFTPGSAKFCRSIWNAVIKDSGFLYNLFFHSIR